MTSRAFRSFERLLLIRRFKKIETGLMIREGFSVGSSASADSVGSTVLVGSRSVYIEKKLADGGYAVVYLAHDTYNQ